VKHSVGINYEEREQGGVPILCLHGIGGDTTSFQPQLDHLGGHVIAWNMPGYGGSEPMPELTFPALADKLREFLDALGIARVHLCGQSIGGMLALEMAFKHPGYVASLALIGTTAAFGGRDESFKDQFIAARLKPLDAGKTIAELADAFVPEVIGPIATDEVIRVATKSMAAVPEDTYRATIRCLVTFNRRSDIETLTIPTCIIAGEHDQNAPARTMALMADKISGAEYHEIKGAGHLINLEAGDQTNAILNQFYDKQRSLP
jgi:3-oxoadipate enol-lactonase